MNHNNQDQREDIPWVIPQEQQSIDESSAEVVASSPSNSNSSRHRRPIVELINNSDNNQQAGGWVIRSEFFDEFNDVVENYSDDQMSDLNDVTDDDDEQRDGLDESSPDEDDEIMPYVRRFLLRENEEDEEDEDRIREIGDEEENDDQVSDDNEYDIIPMRDSSSTTSDESENEEAANYDTSLPVAHRYLGDNLIESSGIEVLIEGSVTTIPIFNLSYVVILPGQVLPIKTLGLNPRVQLYLWGCINRGKTTIGLICAPEKNKIGTTADITNFGTEDDDVHDLKLLLIGRQRFKLLCEPFPNAIDGKVQILPEIELGLPQTNLFKSMMRFLPNDKLRNSYLASKNPKWLIRKYDATNLMNQIKNLIKDWCNMDNVSKNPADFSYWLGANLPISNEERIRILSISCVEARLLWLLEILKNSQHFGCSNCSNVISDFESVFSMSSSGPQCSFVNPNGYIHDTLTVRDAKGLLRNGWPREKDCSWFPGYSWSIVHCNNCQSHIGWYYKRDNSTMIPKKFYGLSRANVKLLYNYNQAPT